MSPCRRGCCYTGLQVCARQRACPCHWDERKPGGQAGSAASHADPTARQAIRNVMAAKGQKKEA